MRTSKAGRPGVSRSRRPAANDGDNAGRAAKISLVSAVLVAVIGALGTIAVAVINKGSGGAAGSSTTASAAPAAGAAMPLPTCTTCTTGTTFPEQAGTGGAAAFRNPLAFAGKGQRLAALQPVAVVCRFFQPDAPPSVAPGWWYLIASPPWSRQYYAPANSFLNGDPPQGPYLANVDSGVPVC